MVACRGTAGRGGKRSVCVCACCITESCAAKRGSLRLYFPVGCGGTELLYSVRIRQKAKEYILVKRKGYYARRALVNFQGFI
jgi:hypothetical protein